MIEKLTEHLQKRQRFSFSKFNDGEFNCIFGVEGKNCDGHEYFLDLSVNLRDVLKSKPDYYLGIGAIAKRVWGGAISSALKKLDAENLNWIDADVLHQASIDNTIWPFFDALNERDVILVGPPHVHDQKLFTVDQNVIIPEQNCWLDGERINDEIIANADGSTVICWCASMASKVWIDFWSPYATNIDMGSLIDPYVGKPSRTHHKKITNFTKP